MGCNGQGLQRFFGERGSCLRCSILDSVVINHLDVVRALGDAGIDPGLGFLWLSEGWNFQAVLGTVAARGSREVTGRSEIRVIERFAFTLLLLDSGGAFGNGEH